jgi:hypothetical protein
VDNARRSAWRLTRRYIAGRLLITRPRLKHNLLILQSSRAHAIELDAGKVATLHLDFRQPLCLLVLPLGGLGQPEVLTGEGRAGEGLTQLEELSADRVKHLRFSHLKLEVGHGRPQLAFAPPLGDLVKAKGVYRVGSRVRIRGEEMRRTPNWDLFSPDRQHRVGSVAGNETCGSIRLDLVT